MINLYLAVQINIMQILIFITRPYIIFPVAIAIGTTIFIAVNRMQSVYQRSLAKKVNEIKQKQFEYNQEKDPQKQEKLAKKHKRAVKKLERRIKRVMFFNKNIIISNKTLLSDDNLALNGQKPFTFNSKLDELISEFNKKHKRHKTINNPKKAKKISSSKANIQARGFTPEEVLSLSNTDEEVKPVVEEVKPVVEEVKPAKGKVVTHKAEPFTTTYNVQGSSIYHDEEDLYTY
ncbi:MAG: hypothetical protein E7359_02440 [Clostridiales bacterium]|nr:hypothetical protein [Clostridiales bacterium]